MSPDLPTQLGETFVQRYDHELTAVATLVMVGLLLVAVDRWFKRRDGRIDPVLETRLRFVRRFVQAVILVIGVATALSQFTALDRFAASVLASGAIAAAVVGFAARQTLANVLAGVMLAVTQPIRIGDLITIEEHTGVVEDVRLTYTFLRTGADTRVIIPNERLAGGILRNDSIVSSTVAVEIELWLAHDADELRAVEVIQEQVEGARASISAVVAEGTTLTVTGRAAAPGDRDARARALRAECLRALRGAGLR
jgi:small-conductance mechanosensitive channel